MLNGRSLAARLSESSRGVPPTALVLLSIVSVQLGAAIAKGLFDSLGPGGTVFVRIAFAALVLLVLVRPTLGGYDRAGYLVAGLFGLALAGMNFSIYLAIDRIPLGVAVTLEFVGPLGVAVAGSRRMLDLLWVVLAVAGILLLAPLGLFGGMDLDPVGVAFALLAGCLWASYILLSARTGSAFPGGTGLVIALCVGTVVLAPFGIAGAGYALLDPKLLLVGFGVAMLSSVITFSLELEALRKIPARVFGVLMSLEPAVAALAGLVILDERLETRAVAAVFFVTVAAAGASLFSRSDGG
ncbi:Integral membrane protein [uncultured Rubrobacteraceae bacterium]|uniref:Integral membrane protein n=1 Tax=uncultured Rubrobacteraceae bacterium TaxID=349277 RepID=A0A6J4PQN8_9ACTN|nr:Integral membrane protein [uncultured Rubrobacteraceae bacterium]